MIFSSYTVHLLHNKVGSHNSFSLETSNTYLSLLSVKQMDKDKVCSDYTYSTHSALCPNIVSNFLLTQLQFVSSGIKFCGK